MTSHPEQLDVTIPGLDALFLDGKWVRHKGPFVDVVSPTTEEVIARVAEPQTSDADAAVAAARKAFDNGPWPNMSVEERVVICSQLCDRLEAGLDEMNRAWTFESGPTLAHGEMIN